MGNGKPYAGQRVRLLVVDDPAMAAEIGRRRDEWKARSGAELTVIERRLSPDNQRLASADLDGADAVIYPAHLLGEIAEQGWLQPIPADVLTEADLAIDDVYRALRFGEATWGSDTVALPLGSRVLVCYYRADLFAKHQKAPPRTWTEYQQLARFFAENPPEGADAAAWLPSAEPLAEGWAGTTLLARAAAYAKRRGYFSALFAIASVRLEPRIGAPPFVLALNELRDTATLTSNGKKQLLQMTPTDTVDAMLAGRCAMALGWPRASAAEANNPSKAPMHATLSADAIGCTPLPGAEQSYSWDKERFFPQQPATVTFLPCRGRLASVTAGAQHSEAALDLLSTLCTKGWSTDVSSASSSTAPFRTSHRGGGGRWFAANGPAAAAAVSGYERAAAETLSSTEIVYAVRIPGHRRYLDALDDAVRNTLREDDPAKPKQALDDAAGKWNAITEELGVKAQIRAYRRSVERVPS